MYTTVLPCALLGVVVGIRAFPDNLITEVLWPEDRIEDDLQIVARRRIAMQIQAARRPQHPVQLHQSCRHHHHIGHHLVLADELAQRPHHLPYVRRRMGDQSVISLLGRPVPVPGVLEGRDLRLRTLPTLLPEEHVVSPVRVKRRVEVDEVNRLIGHVLAQNRQVIAIEQCVFGNRPRHHSLLNCSAPPRPT